MKQWIRIDFVLHGRASLSRVLESEVPTSWVRRNFNGDAIETVATVDVAHMPTCRYELYNATDWYMGRPIKEIYPSAAMRKVELERGPSLGFIETVSENICAMTEHALDFRAVY